MLKINLLVYFFANNLRYSLKFKIDHLELVKSSTYACFMGLYSKNYI